MSTKGERFELRFDSRTLERIDQWRSERPGLPSRSEAVRQLVDVGLGRHEDRQLFQLARFNVLVAAKTAAPGVALLPGAYVYAWFSSIYPLFHELAHIHEPFASQFEVTKDMVEELLEYLDDRWRAEKVPSFYQLEDHYEVRSGTTAWNRHRLIVACRYMCLHEHFDKAFWDTLLKRGGHPPDAKNITNRFDAKSDVYFA